MLDLDEEGILDAVVLEWEEYTDGTKVIRNDPEHDPSWWVDGKVDRAWLYDAWELGSLSRGCHDEY